MIELFTAATPNGWKASITLEELGLPYSVRPVAISEGEQREEWYQAINPNGRIPAIIDHDNDDFAVFESGAILIYLAEKTGKFLPDPAADPAGYYRVLEWLMWQMGGVGPMFGQTGHFVLFAKEKVPYAIERYTNEAIRLYRVIRLPAYARSLI